MKGSSSVAKLLLCYALLEQKEPFLGYCCRAELRIYKFAFEKQLSAPHIADLRSKVFACRENL